MVNLPEAVLYVWSNGGPVLIEDVFPLPLLQSKMSPLSCVKLQIFGDSKPHSPLEEKANKKLHKKQHKHAQNHYKLFVISNTGGRTEKDVKDRKVVIYGIFHSRCSITVGDTRRPTDLSLVCISCSKKKEQVIVEFAYLACAYAWGGGETRLFWAVFKRAIRMRATNKGNANLQSY